LPYAKDGPLHFAGFDPLFLRPRQIKTALGQGIPIQPSDWRRCSRHI
jgi:hypothetical protein